MYLSIPIAMRKTLTLSLLIAATIMGVTSTTLHAQEPGDVDHSYIPLKVKLNDEGSKYLRFIMWHQLWVTSGNLSDDNTNTQLSTSIRRSRLLAYAQISPKFLILTHFGLNSLTTANQTSLGSNGDSPQLFLHGAWGELKVNKHLYMGAGLHYWRGMTRLNNQSTLNFMTLDQSRPFAAWHSLGITDQFARHLGIYAKGSYDKWEYRLAWNNPGRNPLNGGQSYNNNFPEAIASTVSYTGSSLRDGDNNLTGNNIFEGYIKYNIFDNESTKLPYYVGTYLGKKKVLAFGGGFFLHPNGAYDDAAGEHVDVRHFALDAFLDMPVDGGAINSYVAIQSFDYGDNHISRWAGTGTALYGQVGYYLDKVKMMPYIAYSHANYDAATDAVQALDIGVNYYVNGHFCKITAEYHSIINDYREGSISIGGNDQLTQFRLQLHVFL